MYVMCNDDTDAVMSSPKTIIKADKLMTEIRELQIKQEAGIITKSEIKRINSLTKNVIKLLKKDKKIKMEMSGSSPQFLIV